MFLLYTVKVVCGRSDGRVLAPGEYWSAINVYNPNEREVRIEKWVAAALPKEQPGPPGIPRAEVLPPGRAFEIDRDDILSMTPPGGLIDEALLKGYVVLVTELELEVVAVYTAAGATDRIETLEVERISPRCVKAPPPV